MVRFQARRQMLSAVRSKGFGEGPMRLKRLRIRQAGGGMRRCNRQEARCLLIDKDNTFRPFSQLPSSKKYKRTVIFLLSSRREKGIREAGRRFPLRGIGGREAERTRRRGLSPGRLMPDKKWNGLPLRFVRCSSFLTGKSETIAFFFTEDWATGEAKIVLSLTCFGCGRRSNCDSRTHNPSTFRTTPQHRASPNNRSSARGVSSQWPDKRECRRHHAGNRR